MSLEGAMEEERKLIAHILERQQRNSSTGTTSRDRSRGNSSRSLSRGQGGLSRSVSRSLSNLSDTEQPFDITSHDPSERLVKENYDTDENEKHAIQSDEEQISDSDNEFEMEDDGLVLPNYSSFSTNKDSTSKKASALDELSQINNRKLLKEANQAEKLDEILAAERAVANARSIGREVPKDYMAKIESNAKEAGTSIHFDPEKFYQDNQGRKEKLQEYALYKKKLVSPEYSQDFLIPYTSDVEDKIDSELAKMLNEKIKISDIDSDPVNQRAMRTVTRGNFFENLIASGSKHPKSFILCMDFSEESRYALEWCIGTVLVDGSVLFVLNVLEDDEYSSMNLNGIPSTSSQNGFSSHSNKSSREKTRISNVGDITNQIMDLLKLTKLQVHIVIESCHHPIPRHFIVGVIKHTSPTLVIVGSKGTSAIKGVLLGSLSNHLVRKSTAPVMVVKNRLKKLTKKGKQFSNNIGTLHSLAEAKVD